jgi:hypothetical protein
MSLRSPMPRGSFHTPLLRPSRIHCQAEEAGKAEGEDKAEESAAAPAEAEEAAAEEELPADPFAGLDLDSKEFLQRKVEVLEKELADAQARVEELEGDMATVKTLVDRNILKTGTHSYRCPPPTPNKLPPTISPQSTANEAQARQLFHACTLACCSYMHASMLANEAQARQLFVLC